MERITEGVICLEQDDVVYHLCKIEYHYFDDDKEKYVFIPYWNVIDLLPSEIFQGIPGLDMDLRKVSYERDSVPVFIAERTPSENRDDLWQLLEQCGMTYLNRLEWLIRTTTRYFGDNLYVIRYENSRQLDNVNDLTKFNYGDRIALHTIFSMSGKQQTIIKILLRIVASGSYLTADELCIGDKNRRDYFNLLYALNHKAFADGSIQKRGRAKISVSMPKLDEVYSRYCAGELTREHAMQALNIPSASTFYRRIAEYKKANGKK